MHNERLTPKRGRAALENPKVRFEKLDLTYEADTEFSDTLKTEIFKDSSRSVISYNNSPDISMDATLNAYRGCEHGCIYCYARPTHEYLGMSSGLDFESKIFVKEQAPELLRKAMSAKSWAPKVVTMSGITDPYQPLERKMQITRKCLEVFAEFKNPVDIITKNNLVTRDVDLLAKLAQDNLVNVFVSVTSLDPKIARTMEPRASAPQLRLKALKTLSAAGVPVGVMVAPIVPGLTDHEIPQIMAAAADAGARNAAYTIVRLPYAVKDLFETWLETNFPLRKEKILNRIRSMRGGKLYDADFATRMQGSGFYAEQIENLFKASKKRYGLNKPMPLSLEHFKKPDGNQLSLF